MFLETAREGWVKVPLAGKFTVFTLSFLRDVQELTPRKAHRNQGNKEITHQGKGLSFS